ncbi:hypothetical protein NQD34_007742 [Periophthalmus magnuspinnatus]|nr:hypothetical protein NQD34_007742 [Periophthalmus magnuspinnatus]
MFQSRLYLQEVGHSQVHHKHHSLLSLFDVDSEHPERQHITQQPWRQDHTVDYCVQVVLIRPKVLTAPTALVHLISGSKSLSESLIKMAAPQRYPSWQQGVHVIVGCSVLVIWIKRKTQKYM